MAAHKHGSMDITQNKKTWDGFVGFWKYLFAGLIVVTIILMIIYG